MMDTRLEKLLEMLKNQPNDPFLLYAVGFEYEAMGDMSAAGGYYDQIISSHPDYLPVYYQAGLYYANLGEPEKATRLLEAGMALARTQKDNKTLRELTQALEEMD